LGVRHVGRIGVVDDESGTRHLISGNWTDGVNVRNRPEEGSMGARDLRHPWFLVTNHPDSHMVQMMRQSWKSSSPSKEP
jgi:hypothetical protein